MVNEPDEAAPNPDLAMLPSPRGDGRPPERGWAYADWVGDDFAASDDRSYGGPATGLASLGYIGTTLRRTARLWCAVALIGLLAGFGYLAKRPPADQASTLLLVASPPNTAPGAAILNDQAIVQSRTLAADAIRLLRLPETPAIFLTHYSATVLTSQVLEITVKETSDDDAVREANALAAAFLAFQARLLSSQGNLFNASIQQQMTQAQQQANSLERQINHASAQPASAARHAKLISLQAQYALATKALTVATQQFANSEAANQVAITTVVKGSRVLDKAAPVKQSRKKATLLYVGGGLIAGLVLGMGFVIVRALVSNRVYRRDDTARILGAPVRLSVKKVRRGSSWPFGGRGLANDRSPEIRRIVAHLGDMVAPASQNPANLAVVAIDDERVPALCVASLAVSCAKRGLRVVVADLCDGSPAGRLLGTTDPGVCAVTVQDAHLVVVIPDSYDVPSAGPLRGSRKTNAAEPWAAACASADLILTLLSLDPAVGGEHLTGWGESVVAMVTAGRSSAERIYAVGEMVRMAGVHEVSAVLVGTDKADESLGVVPASASDRHEVAAERDGSVSELGSLVVRVGQLSDRAPAED